MHNRRFNRYLYNRLLNEHIVITILTGDAEFDEYMLSKMQNIVNDIPNQKYGIKIFQVPHHGSLDNWDSIKSAKFNFDVYVISFKCGDKGHPDHKVLTELMSAKKYVRFATQSVEYFHKIDFEDVKDMFLKGLAW